MKENKHIQNFNEHRENSNICIDDITKGFKFKMYDDDLTVTKDYEKDGQNRYVKVKKTGKSSYTILDKDVILNYLKSH